MTAWEQATEGIHLGGRVLSQLLLTVSSRLRSYYPLYPPQEDMAIDYENFYAYAQLPVTPDVFIIPSELRYFVKASLNSAFSQTGQNWSLVFPSRPLTPTPRGLLTGMVALCCGGGSRTRKQSVSKTFK